MSPETFFSNENELQAFSNTFYTIFPGDGLYNEGYDNIVKNEIAAEMRDGRTIPASGGGWTWDRTCASSTPCSNTPGNCTGSPRAQPLRRRGPFSSAPTSISRR